MPRKLEYHEILALAGDKQSLHLDVLFSELRQVDPDEMIINTFLETLPARASTPNDSGSIALHIACSNINYMTPDLIDLLVSYYPEGIRVANKFGLMPIHKAAAAFKTIRSIRCVQSVLEYASDTAECLTKDGQTALHIALSNPCISSYQLVKVLIDTHPGAVKVSDSFGHYPLHKAASKAHKLDAGAFDLVLQACTEVAALKDLNGWLPLHWVLSRAEPSLEAVYLLVEAYPEGLFDPDYEGNLAYDKLMQRHEEVGDIRQAVLDVIEVTRTQMLHAHRQPPRVPSPALLELDYYGNS